MRKQVVRGIDTILHVVKVHESRSTFGFTACNKMFTISNANEYTIYAGTLELASPTCIACIVTVPQ